MQFLSFASLSRTCAICENRGTSRAVFGYGTGNFSSTGRTMGAAGGEVVMKRVILWLCLVLLLPFLQPWGASQAHPERHVHSQWIKNYFAQVNMRIQQLERRIRQLEKAGLSQPSGSGAGNQVFLNEACRPDQQKLCQKSCAPGWKIDKVQCIGRGPIGRAYHQDVAVSCYCFDRNDPNCFVEGVRAICKKP